MIFTFWEGPKPAYIDLCMATWPFEYVLLDYSNLHNYTDLPMDLVKQYPLQQVADIVRVHVLRDNGGTWLDADTIVLGDLPEETILGDPASRHNTIGFLQVGENSDMFHEWAAFQNEIIRQQQKARWSMFGNEFTDPYLRENKEIRIGDITNRWPETYKLPAGPRRKQYELFYFVYGYHLKDIRPTDMLMLHNSWTPKKFKTMTSRDVLDFPCTLSNILKEVLK